MLKQIMIPVAAFAVTVAGASAFNGDWIEKAEGLTNEQKSALDEVRTMHEEVKEKSEALLESVGLDREKMKELHSEMMENRKVEMEKVRSAIETKDYEAFKLAVGYTKMAEAIDSEAKFNQLVEAHELREAGKHDEAREIMEELGLPGKFGKGMGEHGRGGMMVRSE